MLTSSKVLAHYNPKLSLRLATDASSYGVGAVLTQVSEEGTERPVALRHGRCRRQNETMHR